MSLRAFPSAAAAARASGPISPSTKAADRRRAKSRIVEQDLGQSGNGRLGLGSHRAKRFDHRLADGLIGVRKGLGQGGHRLGGVGSDLAQSKSRRLANVGVGIANEGPCPEPPPRPWPPRPRSPARTPRRGGRFRWYRSRLRSARARRPWPRCPDFPAQRPLLAGPGARDP